MKKANLGTRAPRGAGSPSDRRRGRIKGGGGGRKQEVPDASPRADGTTVFSTGRKSLLLRQKSNPIHSNQCHSLKRISSQYAQVQLFSPLTRRAKGFPPFAIPPYILIESGAQPPTPPGQLSTLCANCKMIFLKLMTLFHPSGCPCFLLESKDLCKFRDPRYRQSKALFVPFCSYAKLHIVACFSFSQKRTSFVFGFPLSGTRRFIGKAQKVRIFLSPS